MSTVIDNTITRALNYVQTIRATDVIDMLIVAYLLYKLFQIVRRTNSYNLAKGVVLFLVALWLSELFGLTMISFLLRRATELGLLVIVILFQPELRHVLEKIGSRLSSRDSDTSTEMMSAINQTVMACSDMSESKTGALIIFERYVSLGEIIATGTKIDAEVSAELLKNIFYNKAPLHDGAVIIRNSRIAAAGCVLPLSSSSTISKDLGMRHRAGIGISEQSDAVVLIVSEETGAISCAIEGTLKRHLKPQAVDRILRKELTADTSEDEEQKGLFAFARKLFSVKKEERDNDEKDL
jgi:diadenylate cyclase